MNAYQCGACYYPYEEELGLPDLGLALGTKWADVPANFVCPDCGSPKTGFMVWNRD